MVYVTILDVTLVMAGIGILENAGFQKSCYLRVLRKDIVRRDLNDVGTISDETEELATNRA